MVEQYAGDISPDTAWEILTDDPSAVLIDVRTDAEWQYVGVPDLKSIDKDLIQVSWKHFPHMAVNPSFTEEVSQAGVRQDDTVLLLCRSGQRSAEAAAELTAAGFRRCYNIAEGFEGDKDSQDHRGKRGGWKVRGLPWRQN